MSKQRGRLEKPTYPWSPDGDVAADLAIGSVRESLLQWLMTERGIHTETLMVTIGALAGMAAQEAALLTCAASNSLPEGALVKVETSSGETYYFGDVLNGFLIPQGITDFCLWNFVAGAMVSAGVPPEELPDITPIFKHAAATVGGPEFEKLQVAEEHQPHFGPRKALGLFWMPVVQILSRQDVNDQPLAKEHWIIVLALVANQFIDMGKGALDPKISGELVMGAAVVSSKLDRLSLKFDKPR